MRLASLFACCLMLAACSGGGACPEGTFRRAGACVPLNGSVDAGPDSGLRDGGVGAADGGMDGAVDGALPDGAIPDGALSDGALSDGAMDTDAGPCGVCPEARPICDAARGECVECTASEAGACGDFLCDLRTGDCSDRVARSADLCAPCVADAECLEGASCVTDPDDGETRCHWREDAEPGPGGSCVAGGRPFSAPLDATSVDGAAVRVCTLARSSCAAYLDYVGAQACGAAADCGMGASGARCVDADPGPGESLRCSVACVTAADCPPDVACVASTGACQP